MSIRSARPASRPTAPAVRTAAALPILIALAACAGAEGGAGDPLDEAARASVQEGADAEQAGSPKGTRDDPRPADHPPTEPDGSAAATRTGRSAQVVHTEERRDAPPPPVAVPDERPTFERPEHVRGLYLNKWAAGSPERLERLIGLARRTEVNAFVIDVKDVSGSLSYASGVPLAREVGATGDVSIADLPQLLRRLSEEGIWPIARVVIVKDPLLAAARPDLAVQDTAGGVWVDGNGDVWLNPWSGEVRDYHMALAREAAALGFPEIQWDYVRFADAPSSELARATYPGRDGDEVDAIRAFLEDADATLEELGVVHTADVFGVTTSAGDIGIGQVWEHFIDVVDVALPMVYPSHYWRGSFGYERPNAHPYEIVREALERGLARSEGVEGAGTIRPWLQDFSMGEPGYGAPEVRAQIEAAQDLGIREWLLWNASSRYTEEALMPVGGWAEEPLVRIADRHVPLSLRHETLRAGTPKGSEVPALEALPAVDVAPAPDAGELTSAPAIELDSVAAAADTVPGGGR